MPQRIVPFTVIQPGFNGLNTQQLTVENPTFAKEATNCVIDNAGRLAARKGWTALNATPISGSPTVDKLHEHIDTAGTGTIISAAGNKLYSGTSTPTDITGALTPSGDNWKFQQFNGKLVGWQDGESPVVWTGSGNFAAISAAGGGTVPNGDEVLAAFGRLWATKSGTDKTVIRYSDLLDETTWDDSASPGDAGTLDLKGAQGWGNDAIVAIREHNGLLVIFGKTRIALYQGAWNPNNTGLSYVDAEFQLVDIIQGVGAYGRDCIVSIGTDLIFLSDSGIRSLARTIQERSLPISDLSVNIRDDLVLNLVGETAATIETEYNESEGFVLFNLKNSGFVYVLDVRRQLEDGTYRVTKWDSIAPKAMYSSRDGTLYLGQTGYIGKYADYYDNASTYDVVFRSAWTSVAGEIQNRYKIPKTARALIFGGAGYTITFDTYFDYEDEYLSYSTTLPLTGASEFGVSEFGVDEFNGLGQNNAITFAPSGIGHVIQFGFHVTINGNAFALQRLTYLIKIGREA